MWFAPNIFLFVVLITWLIYENCSGTSQFALQSLYPYAVQYCFIPLLSYLPLLRLVLNYYSKNLFSVITYLWELILKSFPFCAHAGWKLKTTIMMLVGAMLVINFHLEIYISVVWVVFFFLKDPVARHVLIRRVWSTSRRRRRSFHSRPPWKAEVHI